MTIEPRLATHMQVSAFIRLANAGGDFAAVLRKGDATAGAILLIGLIRGQNPVFYERYPTLDGLSAWQASASAETMSQEKMAEFIEKRSQRDPDLWIIELDAADHERLDGLLRVGD
jgi:hypothetical protein